MEQIRLIVRLIEFLSKYERATLFEILRKRYTVAREVIPALLKHDEKACGPIENKLLPILSAADVNMREDDILCALWSDAPRILTSGTPEERRRLRNRLSVQIAYINDKLRRQGETRRIVRVRETDDVASLYLADE